MIEFSWIAILITICAIIGWSIIFITEHKKREQVKFDSLVGKRIKHKVSTSVFLITSEIRSLTSTKYIIDSSYKIKLEDIKKNYYIEELPHVNKEI